MDAWIRFILGFPHSDEARAMNPRSPRGGLMVQSSSTIARHHIIGACIKRVLGQYLLLTILDARSVIGLVHFLLSIPLLIFIMSFDSIPILDLSLARDIKTKPHFLEQLRHALLEVGFLYLKNIGIREELIQQVKDEGVRFFDLPIEEK